MRDSFDPEEVDQIENKAYKVGIKIGARQECERIIALLEDYHESITVQSASTAGGSWALRNAISLIKGENK